MSILKIENEVSGLKKVRSVFITVLMYLLVGITILLFLSNVLYISVILPAKWLYSNFGIGFIIFAIFILACLLLYPAIHLTRIISAHKKTPIVLATLGGAVLLSIVGLFLYDQVYREYKEKQISNDSSEVYEDEPKGLLSFFNNDESVDDEEYEDNCSELPLYCYEMTSCSQAEEALECGNYDLDRDDDGVPCESLCGSY